MDPHSDSQMRKKNEAEQRSPVEAEQLEMDLSWGEAQLAAKDHDRWRNSNNDLCPKGGEEHK